MMPARKPLRDCRKSPSGVIARRFLPSNPAELKLSRLLRWKTLAMTGFILFRQSLKLSFRLAFYAMPESAGSDEDERIDSGMPKKTGNRNDVSAEFSVVTKQSVGLFQSVGKYNTAVSKQNFFKG